MQYDLNKDEKITRDEVDQTIAADFKTADKDGNGSLDETEFKTFHADRRAARKAAWEAAKAEKADEDKSKDADKEHRGRRGMRGDMFKHTDWNLDGSISPDEFGTRARMMAARVDRDGDGTITAEEREQRRGRWHRDGDKSGETKPDEQE
jgi:Ca2+-binding EF-hand superfamily protein